MSNFSFQFNVEPELLDQDAPLEHIAVQAALSENQFDGVDSSQTDLSKKECFQVFCPSYEEGECNIFSVHNIGDFVFKEALVDRSVASSELSATLLQNHEDHDLIPGHYEGGFKIWECTYDLANTIVKSSNVLSCSPKRILELGCGHGVPGILASKVFDDISEIVFSDFNSEVLQMTTWPNILLNCSTEMHKKVKCIAGDWSLLHKVTGKFDLILSAETLYSAGSCQQVNIEFEMFAF